MRRKSDTLLRDVLGFSAVIMAILAILAILGGAAYFAAFAFDWLATLD